MKQMAGTGLKVAAGAALVMCLFAAPVTSQVGTQGEISCGGCGARLDGFGNIIHSFMLGGDLHDCEPNTCHAGYYWSFCAYFHYFCGGGASIDLDEPALDSRIFAEMESAVAGGDAGDLRRLLNRYSGFARYVPTRQAIQMTGCAGAVLVHLPVDRDIAVKLID